MSIRDCIIRAADGGEIDRKRAKELTDLYDEISAEAGLFGPVDRSKVDRAFAEQMTAENLLRKRREALQLQAVDRIKGDLAKAGERGLKVADAAKLLLENYGEAPFDSVIGRKRAIVGLFRAEIADIADRFERTWATGVTPNRADLDNIVRELHGEKTGDAAAKAMADAFAGAAETLRQRFNAAGGSIGKLEGWGLPHSHDQAAVWNAGRDAWKAEARQRFDRNRMTDPLTKQPFTDKGWENQLDRLFDKIVTNGDIDLTPSRAVRGRGALASQHADHRFIVFKSADDWMAYDKQFGRGNAFNAMLDYGETLARDTAMIEILGPNPASTITWLKDLITVERAKDAQAQGGKQKGGVIPWAASPENLLDNIYDDISGAAFTVKGSKAGANVMSGLRNLQSATKLGGAVLSSVNDLANQAWARGFAGLSGTPFVSAIGDTASALSKATRDEALRAGLATERVLTVLQNEAQQRHVADGWRWSQWMADRTLAISGLTGFTRAEREGFGLRFLSDVTERKDLGWSDLKAEHPRFAATFERYGLNEGDWNAIRATPLQQPGDILTPKMVERSGNRDAAERLLGMVLMETEFATLQRVHRVYAGENMLGFKLNGERGTVQGEFVKSAAQLKGYTLMVTKLQAIRAGQVAAASGERYMGGAYFAGWFLSMTLLGGLALQLKEIARGKDPRAMNDERFWGEAALQGGGLGIMGDFIRAETNRMGGGAIESMMGPLFSTASQIGDLALTTPMNWWNDKEVNPGRQVRRLISNNTPMIPFYLRTMYERAVLDRLQEVIDPDAKRAFRDQVRKSAREYEQEWWWQPGSTTPDRAPALEAALGF